MTTTFKQLDAEQQEEIAPLAAQANQWLAALVSVLKQASSRDERATKIIMTLEAAMRAALAINHTLTFQHFAHECRGAETIELMTSGDTRFITEVVPRIRILQHVNLTTERWNSFSDTERQKIKQIVAQLGRMVQAFETYKQESEAEAEAETSAALASAHENSEFMNMVLSQLPAGASEQLEKAGGIDAIMRMANQAANGNAPLIPGDTVGLSNQLVAALTGGGGAGGPLAGILGSGGAAGAMGLIAKFKDAIGELPENPTAEQKKAFYVGIAEFIKKEVHSNDSILSNVADMFENYYPDGLSPSELASMLDRARGFLIIGGAKKNDSAWFILKQLKVYHKRMQKKTRHAPMLKRGTFGIKVVTLLEVAFEDSVSGVEELIEAATNSDVLKGLVGKFTGMPVAEVTK